MDTGENGPMTTPSGQPAPEPDPVRQLARLFLTQLLAVVAVATVIAVVFTLAGRGTGTDVASDDAAGSSSSSAAPPESSSSPPSTTAPPSTPAPSTSAPAATTSTTSAAGGPVKVDVLNQSAGNGSAERTADDLRGAGWKIGRVDDFHGNVGTTTVYWLSPKDRRQARQISRFLGGVRVRQGFDTLVDGRVSVILVEKP
jgi:hypothetical protein